MTKLLCIVVVSWLLSLAVGLAQIPITVTRSAVQSGSAIALPDFTGYAAFVINANEPNVNFAGGFLTAPVGDNWGYVYGDVYSSPLSFKSPTVTEGMTANVTIRATPTIVVSTNAPSIFTNSITATVEYRGNSLYRASTSQTYVVTIVDDGIAGLSWPMLAQSSSKGRK